MIVYFDNEFKKKTMEIRITRNFPEMHSANDPFVSVNLACVQNLFVRLDKYSMTVYKGLNYRR